MINRLLRISRRAEVDRAVFLGVLAKIWSLGTGPFTAIFIATKFTPELQGYYYTFGSIIALQIFVELGLGTVIIQFASHEWSSLTLDKNGYVIGDSNALSRLISLTKIIFKWYLLGAAIIIVGLSIAGYFFFDSTTHINWTAPWLSLCILAGITILTVPLLSLLEGCNQVSNVYTYRFFQGVCLTLSAWVAIWSGAKLWTASIASFISLLCMATLLLKNYNNFFKQLFFSNSTGPSISWKAEILPMQWRIALGWIVGYFMFSMFTPILFYYHGPVVAGQMGMTWSLVSIISAISFSWILPKAPRFGMLIAQRKFDELNALFRRLTIIVTLVACFMACSIITLMYFLYSIDFFLAERMLPPLPTALFAIASVFLAISFPFSTYLRAHKKEPLLVISITSGILIVLSNFTLGKYYSATGMAMGYLVINLLMLPIILLIWNKFRLKWHY